MGDGRWEMGDGRWEMGDGRWEMGDGRWEMGDGRWEMGDGREWGREGGKGVKIPSTRATGAYWARRMSIRWQSILMSTLSFSPSFKFAMKVDNSIQLIKNTFTSLLPSSPPFSHLLSSFVRYQCDPSMYRGGCTCTHMLPCGFRVRRPPCA